MLSQVYPLMRRASRLGTEVPNDVQGFSPGGPGYRKWTLSDEEPYLWAQRIRTRWGASAQGGQDIASGRFQVKNLTSEHRESE